jgi:hypothetical protein
MAYIDRIKPEEYNAIVAAFGQVGAPVYARVALIINAKRKVEGKGNRNVAFATLKKAWEKGWVEQTNGRPAPAIKTLFPNYAPEPERTTESKTPAALPGAASVGASDAVSQTVVAARHEELAESLVKSLAPKLLAMIPATSDQALKVSDPMAEAARRIEAGILPARANEMTVLANTRRNLLALQEVSGTIVAELVRRKPFLLRLVADLESSEQPTLRSMRETVRELVGLEKDITLAIKNNQESQRLLEGAPQRIEERRGVSQSDDVDMRAVKRLASMLRTKVDRIERYDGEETGDVQDVEFTEPGAPTENAIDSGKAAANETDPVT